MPTDTIPAAGVAYHLADIYVDEVDTVTEDSRPPSKVLFALLQPFLDTLTSSPSQALLHRIRFASPLRLLPPLSRHPFLPPLPLC